MRTWRCFLRDPDADQSTWGFFSQTDKGHGRLTTRSVRTTTEMNDWFATEWTGIAQSFQVTRTVKRKCRRVIEQAQPQTQASEPQAPSQPQTQVPPAPKTKPSKKRKQVIFVEETSQQVVYGFSNLTPAEASPEAIATFLRNHWAIENRLRLLARCHLARRSFSGADCGQTPSACRTQHYRTLPDGLAWGAQRS